MKLREYKTYDNYKTITFESNADYQVEFVVLNHGDIIVEAQGIKLADIKECIAIIESGKLEIIL